VLKVKDWVTLANAGSGALAILLALRGSEYWVCAFLVGLAAVFDVFDGRIARKTGSVNEFGKALDSLSDAVSFGVAPVVLVNYWAGADALLILASAFFVCSAVLHLAKYDVQKDKHYYGLPTPVAALTLIILVPFTGNEYALVAVLAFAMNLPFRIRRR